MRTDDAWGRRGWLCTSCRLALAPGTRCTADSRFGHEPLDLSDPSARARVISRTWGWEVAWASFGRPYMSFRDPRRALRSVERALSWAWKRARRGVAAALARPRGTSWAGHIPRSRGVMGTVRGASPEVPPFGGSPCVAYGIELRLRNGRVTLRDGGSAGFTVELDDGRVVRVGPGALVMDASSAARDPDAEIAGYLWWVGAERAPHEPRELVPFHDAYVVRLVDGARVELRGELRMEATDAYRGLVALRPEGLPIVVPLATAAE